MFNRGAPCGFPKLPLGLPCTISVPKHRGGLYPRKGSSQAERQRPYLIPTGVGATGWGKGGCSGAGERWGQPGAGVGAGWPGAGASFPSPTGQGMRCQGVAAQLTLVTIFRFKGPSTYSLFPRSTWHAVSPSLPIDQLLTGGAGMPTVMHKDPLKTCPNTAQRRRGLALSPRPGGGNHFLTYKTGEKNCAYLRCLRRFN